MLTVRELAKITKGIVGQGDASGAVSGISIDSRTVKAGEAYIAILGQRLDGHRFLRQAVERGVAAVVISKAAGGLKGVSVIRVKDTTIALGQIAAWHRQQYSIPIVAVTGSVGKTTVKEMIAAVLEARFKVLKNVKTENNQYGVPMTLLKLNASYQAAVLELGASQPGDIRWLAQIVRPTTAVFTNIGESHLEKLKNLAGVFREKTSLIKYVEPGGSVIFNLDDRYLKRISEKRGCYRQTGYGCGRDAQYRASRIMIENNRCLHFTVNSVKFSIRTSGVHNVSNALAAISCGAAHKIRYNDMVAALAEFQFGSSRQDIQRFGQIWLIDDTYNANPVSFKSAVDTLERLKVRGKKIAVCGDMKELGLRSEALHRSLGRMMAQSDIDAVLTIGEQARSIALGYSQGGKGSARPCKDLAELHRRLKRLCHSGDAVLVKGSRAMCMERTVAFLKARFSSSYCR